MPYLIIPARCGEQLNHLAVGGIIYLLRNLQSHDGELSARGVKMAKEPGAPAVNEAWGFAIPVIVATYRNLPNLKNLQLEAGKVVHLLQAIGFKALECNMGSDTMARSLIDSLRTIQLTTRRAVVYWGGHGKALHGGEFYLCRKDTSRHREPDEHTAVSAATLGRLLADFQVPEIVLLVDACGAGGGAEEITRAFRAKVARSGSQTSLPALSVISSACQFQTANESVFTRAIVEVFREGAPRDPNYLPWTERDSHITPNELAQALRAKLIANGSSRLQIPDHHMVGIIGRFFPNPRFRPNAPDLSTELDGEQVDRRIILPDDVADHFMVKFRGIDTGDEQGWYFTGRETALRQVVRWLRSGSGLLVITGPPGCGKSALLGRIAITSVPQYRDQLEKAGQLAAFSTDTLPEAGSLSAGVHGKNKSLLDCVRELARALDIDTPVRGWQSAADLVGKVSDLAAPTTILLDALDEARQSDVYDIATDLLCPLAELAHVRVLVGTRPGYYNQLKNSDDWQVQSLLAALKPETSQILWLDQDNSQDKAIAEYAFRRILAVRGSIYRNQPIEARRAADAIAAHSAGIFLFARVLSRVFARQDTIADLDSPESLALLRGGLGDAIAADLNRYGSEEQRVRDLLMPLAWAEGLGVPRRQIWLAMVNALSSEHRYSEADLVWLLEHAGSYLVIAGEDGQTVFRLYHQSFNDIFRRGSNASRMQSFIVDALLESFEFTGARLWQAANPYVLRNLAVHAAECGRLASLCEDSKFLVHADPVRLQDVLGTVDHRKSVLARLYWRAFDQLQNTKDSERLELLKAVALRDEPDAIDRLHDDPILAWRPLWSETRQTAFHRPLFGHFRPVLSSAMGEIDGRTFLVTGGGDKVVRCWDPLTGVRCGAFAGHGAPITAVALGSVGRRGIVASGDTHGAVYVWDIVTGKQITRLRSKSGGVFAISLVRISDVSTACVVGDEGGAIRVWDLPNCNLVTALLSHHTTVRALTMVSNTLLMLSGGDDGVLRIWDIKASRELDEIDTIGHILSIGTSYVDGELVAAIGGYSGALGLWSIGRRCFIHGFKGHDGAIGAIAFVRHHGRDVLATAGDDGGVRLWDPATSKLVTVLKPSRVLRATVLETISREQLAIESSITPHEEESERSRTELAFGNRDSVLSLQAMSWSKNSILTTGGIDGVVRMWDIGSSISNVNDQREFSVTAIAYGRIGAQEVVAIGERNGLITIRNPITGAVVRELIGHDRAVLSLAFGKLCGEHCLASGGDDSKLIVWDAQKGTTLPEMGYEDPQISIYATAFIGSGNKDYLVHPIRDGIVRMATDSGKRSVIPFLQVSYLTVCHTRSGDLLAAARPNGDIWLLSPELSVIGSANLGSISCAPVSGVVDGKDVLVVGGWNRDLVVWDVAKRDVIKGLWKNLADGSSSVNSLSFVDVNEENGLAIAANDGGLCIVHTMKDDHVMHLPSHHGPIRALQFGTVGGVSTLVSGGDDGAHAISLQSINTSSPPAEPSSPSRPAEPQTARSTVGDRVRQLMRHAWSRGRRHR